MGAKRWEKHPSILLSEEKIGNKIKTGTWEVKRGGEGKLTCQGGNHVASRTKK